MFENLEFTKNFNQLIFQGIVTIYLISRAFLTIVRVQEKLSVLLKIIKENLPLRLESGFSCY